MADREVEIQVQVEDVRPLKEVMEQEGEKIRESRQVDKYFAPSHRDFTEKDPVEEWLRLRIEDGEESITYKNWYYNEEGKSTHCDEYETEVEDIGQLEKIFEVLDFKKIVEVDKYRTSYRYKDYEISIDKVAQLGNFVEVEHKGDDGEDPEEVISEMVEFLKDLRLGKINRNFVGYAYMMLRPGDVEVEVL